MIELSDTIQKWYKDNPEAWNMRQYLLRQNAEQEIRTKRRSELKIEDLEIKYGFVLGESKYLDHRLEIENRLFSEKELKCFHEIESLIDVSIGFGHVPEDKDITKIIKKYESQ